MYTQDHNLKMQVDSYQKIKILGEGTYGKCYLVINRNSQQLCVLKQIEIFGMSQQEINEAVREAHILEALNHPFIVKFLGSFQTKEGYLNIIMGYADGGDLNQKIKQMRAKETTFTQTEILRWFTQMCLAIKHVHDRKIIHRDIKTQNIFMTKNGDIQLGDFGIAKPLQLTLQKIKSVVGTPYYMSPEICENKEYSFKTDIWSLGVILLQMCLLKPPFDANSLPALALKIAKGQYNPVPRQYSKQLRKLVGELLQVDPARRPTINEVLKNRLIISRIDGILPKGVRDSQFSHTTLHTVNIFQKHASRGMFIDCQLDFSEDVQSVISPKSSSNRSIPAKHSDMPVKRVDNYTKDQKMPIDKKQKKKNQLRRRDISEPNLTPKNQLKAVPKINSLLNLEKKKSQHKDPFKKKPQNIIEEIYILKEEIVGDKNILTSKQNPIKALEISELNPIEDLSSESDKEQHSQEQKSETLVETLEQILRECACDCNIAELYATCSSNGGICNTGPCSGLVTLAYALKNESA